MIEITVDLETTANGGPDGDSPEAHWSVNKVLMCGWRLNGCTDTNTSCLQLAMFIKNCLLQGTHVTLIGHNLKFDLKYLMRDYPEIQWHKLDYKCTMHMAYRLSGHKDKFMSLEAACKANMIPFAKSLDLTAILASGLKMEDINKQDLELYLRADVKATEELCHKLSNIDPDLLSCSTLPLAHIELTGMPLDRKKTKTLMKKLIQSEALYAAVLWTTCYEYLQWSDHAPIEPKDVKINAPRTISYILTGYPQGGLSKGKKGLFVQSSEFPMMTQQQIDSMWPGVEPTHLGYPVPIKILEKISKECANCTSYIDAIISYRQTGKLMNTYVGPFLEATKTEPHLHPKLHMVSTGTGRISSANPNGQNLPGTARELIKSEHGRIMEIDFKQLEMVAAATVSKDQQLIADLNNGVDVHFETGKVVFGWKTPSDMTKKERTLVKNVNFGLLYGGGPKGLSVQTGQSQDTIKKLISAFYQRYPTIEQWQEDFFKEVASNLQPYKIDQGEQVYQSMVTLPDSGRKFWFCEKTSPYWLQKKTGRKFSFKPTETKNYPIQGFAGGDIVMTALVELYPTVAVQPKTNIIMTVHDSILLDTDKTEAWVAGWMDVVCDTIKRRYNIPVTLEFNIESGTHWK